MTSIGLTSKVYLHGPVHVFIEHQLLLLHGWSGHEPVQVSKMPSASGTATEPSSTELFELIGALPSLLLYGICDS